MLDRLEEIKARAEKASPGPWLPHARSVFNTGDEDEKADGMGWDVMGPPAPMLRGMFSRAGDAWFIALSREDIPYLLRRLDAAEKVATSLANNFAILSEQVERYSLVLQALAVLLDDWRKAK